MVKKSKTMFQVDIYNGVAKGDSPRQEVEAASQHGRAFRPRARLPLLQVQYAV
ncbi:hypothetical protein [Pseudomonas aeruginosa]|uniref:hypothetical protein n=1 Tax=Pseudomonas aeruginosa TaxID=287 RepID=UPI0021B27CA9|nr:hypothetical protein [Pseudomonas aeruginosa]MCT7418368.1 hypothetical protein [Pseudomonas aeruginosa]